MAKRMVNLFSPGCSAVSTEATTTETLIVSRARRKRMLKEEEGERKRERERGQAATYIEVQAMNKMEEL